MADSAISGLTALGEAPEGKDLIEIVCVSEAVAADRSRSVTLTNLFDTVLTYDQEVVCYEGDVVTL